MKNGVSLGTVAGGPESSREGEGGSSDAFCTINVDSCTTLPGTELSVQAEGVDQGGLGGKRIKGSRGSCRLGVRLCDREKDLYEPFLRRLRGLEIARDARGKVEGNRRARSKKERDWWVRVTRSRGKSAST